jgi:hypothetical protein
MIRSSGYSDTELALLSAVLDTLIPATGDLPAAGAMGCADFIAGETAGAPEGDRIRDALARVASIAPPHYGHGFDSRSHEQREEILRQVEATARAEFDALVEYAYRAYYTDPRVHEALGMGAEPPQPRGFELPMFDEGLLTQQRERTPFWRPA